LCLNLTGVYAYTGAQMRAIGKERVDEEDKNLDEEDGKFEH
jgi:hypothetical protein